MRCSGGAFNLVRTNEKIGWNFPRFTDLVDHIDGERAPGRQKFPGSRARTQEFCQLGLRMPELLDRILEHVDRVKTVTGVDRSSLRFVQFHERKQHIELVTLLCTPGGTPAVVEEDRKHRARARLGHGAPPGVTGSIRERKQSRRCSDATRDKGNSCLSLAADQISRRPASSRPRDPQPGRYFVGEHLAVPLELAAGGDMRKSKCSRRRPATPRHWAQR